LSKIPPIMGGEGFETTSWVWPPEIKLKGTVDLCRVRYPLQHECIDDIAWKVGDLKSAEIGVMASIWFFL
jgi:hypothetical protein